MASHEEIEKVRQEIMRFQELLAIMRQKLESGEQAYAQLFSKCTPKDMKDMPEKQLQWKAAEEIVDDVSQLRRAILQMRFESRNLERAFEELHDIIAAAE